MNDCVNIYHSQLNMKMIDDDRFQKLIFLLRNIQKDFKKLI